MEIDEEYIAELGNQIAELKTWKQKVEGNLVYTPVREQMERNALRSMNDASEELTRLQKKQQRSRKISASAVGTAILQIPAMYFVSLWAGLITCMLMMVLSYAGWRTAPHPDTLASARSHAKTTAYDYEDLMWHS